MKHSLLALFFGLGIALCAPAANQSPNVIFIAIDDQNDWVGHLGGHPLVRTPHIDRLASRGTAFLNAHCQAPICNPSRASLLTGLRPTTTGIYGLAPWFRELPEYRDWVTLPQHFALHGYKTLSTGKIFHQGHGQRSANNRELFGTRPYLPEFEVEGQFGGIGVKPESKLIPPTWEGNHPLMDWGVFPHTDEDKGDYQVASWAVDQIHNAPPDRPFFLAAGFFLPHVPLYVTESWYALYADASDADLLPAIRPDDREDTPRFSWYLHWLLPEPRLDWVRQHNQWRNLVRSYLASTSFVDAQIGRILTALDEAGLTENTIVVLWSDHGYHLGEKLITGKNTLWHESTRVPLVLAGPGITAGQRCPYPAELLDLFPTLIDLCGLSPRPELEGISLRPQLEDAAAVRARPAITSHNQGNHSVVTERWRFIQYADGSEELYDLKSDPHEWQNLAKDPQFLSILESHRRWLPTIDNPPAPGSQHRILEYDPATDTAIWQGSPVTRDEDIPF